MNNLNNLVFNSLEKYFNRLGTFGYTPYIEVDKLIVLLFIDELIDGDLSIYITEKDYKIIVNVLYKIFGTTCIIPYPSLELNTKINPTNRGLISRITEGLNTRFTETNFIRVEK